jgi:hypothetical protein
VVNDLRPGKLESPTALEHAKHSIDCHVLTLPRFDPTWVAALKADLDEEPVTQHWLAGVEGDLAESRARGYASGCAAFVTSADPDDRIHAGTFASLQKALLEHPRAPFAWAGEQMVDEALRPLQRRAHIAARGYEPVLHVMDGTHVHGVKVYRREVVMSFLETMKRAGPCCELFLDLAILRPWTNPPESSYPVHVPIVGRLWRWHGKNGSQEIRKSDFDRAAQVLGFASFRDLQKATAWAVRSPAT